MRMYEYRIKKFVGICIFFEILVLPFLAHAITERISQFSFLIEGNGESTNPELSYDGRYVAFSSYASNLISNDTNVSSDVFLYDRSTHIMKRSSVSATQNEGNGTSYSPSISFDGRYVAFVSTSSNLVQNDTNNVDDIFVHDHTTGMTERVSVSSFGAESNNLSQNPSISGDGRYVVFSSDATNLVQGDTNGVSDIFMYDRDTNLIQRISLSSLQAQVNGESVFPSISSDGRYVAYVSFATNLVAGDINGFADVFVHDTLLQTTKRVSCGLSNANTNDESFSQMSLSSDGRYIAFNSMATNIVVGDINTEEDVFLFDQLTGTTELVSRPSFLSGLANGSSSVTRRAVNWNAQYITFSSLATNLSFDQDVNGESDVFVYDRSNHLTTRVSINGIGIAGDHFSGFSSISDNGMYIGFHSVASNLISTDTNNLIDSFVYHLQGILTHSNKGDDVNVSAE